MKILVISDTHCGHIAGLTPLKCDYKPDKASKYYQPWLLRRRVWRWFCKEVEDVSADILVINGDAIDGFASKTGGRELITSDISEQADMAVEIAKTVNAKQVYMTYGTAYHTGDDLDWEDEIAYKLRAEIKSRLFLKVDGVTFDVKHHLGSSSVPHGRATAILRDKLWADLMALRGEQPKSDIIIRSHVHYFNAITTPSGLIMTTPALQSPSTIYGKRRCSGITDLGMVSFDVANGNYSWKPHLLELRENVSEVIKVDEIE